MLIGELTDMEVEILLILLGGFLSVIGTLLLMEFKRMRGDIHGMRESVDNLNIKIAEIILDQSWHKKELDVLKMDIAYLKKESARAKERLHTLEGHWPHN